MMIGGCRLTAITGRQQAKSRPLRVGAKDGDDAGGV